MPEYAGAFRPWADEIAALHRKGRNFTEIADALTPRVRRYYSYRAQNYGLSAGMVRYILARNGMLKPTVPARRHDVTFNPPRGRPLDMGGPRNQWIDYDPWERIA